MAGAYDTEQERMIDRIKCIAFREVHDAGATFINRQWIAHKIHRTTRFATKWWKKSYEQCFTVYSNTGRKLKLSQASQGIIQRASGLHGKSCSILTKEIAEEQNEYVTGRTINNYRHREGLKPFDVIPKSLKSEIHVSDRLWLCDWLEGWNEEDFLYLAPSDQFCVWLARRPKEETADFWDCKSLKIHKKSVKFEQSVKNP